MKTKRNLNGGFSLIELLVSIAILGVIVAPLLHAFVTGSNVAKRSREIGNVTEMAQNVAEAIEAADINDLGSVRMVDSAGNEITPTVSSTGGTINALSYTVNYDLGQYSALVTLDSTKYAERNAQEVTSFSPMEAVFLQPSGELNPDTVMAYTLMQKAWEGVPAEPEDCPDADKQTVTWIKLIRGSWGANGSYRTGEPGILISIHEGNGTYTYSCTYTYTLEYSYRVYAQDGTWQTVTDTVTDTTNYPFYSETLSAGKNLSGLYFFFSELPGVVAGIPTESSSRILIDHTGTTSVDVFLAKQGSELEQQSGTFLEGTNCQFEVYERSYSSDENFPTTVHSNIRNARYKIRYDDGIVHMEITKNTYDNTLVAKNTLNRLYEMTVEIKNGDETVYTLTGTKLN